MSIKHFKITFITVSIFCPLFIWAQQTFKPVLTTGKTWEVATFNRSDGLNETQVPTGHYIVSVGGDTLVNGLECTKIVIDRTDGQHQSMEVIAREEDGKVWRVNNDGSLFLFFNMSLKRHDPIDAGFVLMEDVVYVNGTYRKRLTIDSGTDGTDGTEYLYYIVEGIGISKDEWLADGGLGIAQPGEYCRMVSCSENGVVVFTYDDFIMPSSSLNSVKTNHSIDAVYDLNGRVVSNFWRGGIFIKGDKKIIF